jgi:hypothetical protein
MRFVTGVIEEVGALAPGPYDYVDCCGVLHHLASPEAGLAALASQVAPTGGLGLMLYATYGRSGIYPVQEALAQLVDDLPDKERLAAAHRLLAGLPASHLLNRNPLVSDHRKGKDAHLYDLLLHRRDRAYRVPELVELLATAGLEPLAWIEPARYAPETYLTDPMLRQRAAALPPVERAALAERLSTTIGKHILYAGFADRPAKPAPDPGADGTVLVLRGLDPAAVAKGLKPGGKLRSDIGVRAPGRVGTGAVPVPAEGGSASEVTGESDGARRLEGPGPVGPEPSSIRRSGRPERLVGLDLRIDAGNADVLQHAIVHLREVDALLEALAPGREDGKRSREDSLGDRGLGSAHGGGPEHRASGRDQEPAHGNLLHIFLMIYPGDESG